MSGVAYFTDVEGLWHKLEDFARGNPLVSLDGERLILAENATLVFGGDAIDRGPSSMRVVRALLSAKRTYGDRVVLLAGNRDINKMRLARELAGFPPPRAVREIPGADRPTLLRFIFELTMGAKKAFEMRRSELAEGGSKVSDEDVVESFAADVTPGGAITEYLAECQLVYRQGATLFVHGAVTEESLGVVPGEAHRIPGTAEWIEALNAFYRAQITAFRERRFSPEGEPLWAPLVAYQAPVPGTRLHQASVVYGRPADSLGNPVLPSRSACETLQRDGIVRVIVGHTPSGDSPSVLCDDGFQLVIADNSYSRNERGSKVIVQGDRMTIRGCATLDDGTEGAVETELHDVGARGPVGLRDAATGRLVKGTLASGELLSFRFLKEFTIEQTALSPDDLAALTLVVPR